jgi:hypothetical protein
MGMVLEHQGDDEKALRFYHASLRYALQYKNSKNNNEGQCYEKSPSSSSSVVNGDSTITDEKIDNGVVGCYGGGGGSRRKRSSSGGSSGGAGAPAEYDRNWLDDIENGVNNIDGPFSLMEVRMSKSVMEEDGEMELFLEKRFDQGRGWWMRGWPIMATSDRPGFTTTIFSYRRRLLRSAAGNGPNVGSPREEVVGTSPTSISP